ncbi:MAG: mandelate racemase/muconate lactonizing enzyme family protein [bacterium]|nr:mandelate racemase/muconate lactonizing enzyme family protein [bacterium]MDT8396452.1 mandelate racemase/muconate lactonizing enzyme family protein [bacterium]
MKIVDIQERTASIASSIRNAYIDFSKMTVSVVALVTDVVRDGRPVVGYGFNSNGRYAQGSLLRERFIPRVLEADPATYVSESQGNLDPFRLWDLMMTNEKPGGHGERSVAVGVIDMAIWDAAAKIEGKPLYRLLAERYNEGRADDHVFVYAAGGYYYPGKETGELRDEMSRYLDGGYSVVKMKIGGAPMSDDLRRIEAVLKMVSEGERLAVDANGRFNLEAAVEYGDALTPYGLRWYEEPGDPLDYQLHADLAEQYNGPLATGENLFSMQDARNLLRHAGLRPDRDILQMDPVLSYGLVEYLRMIEMIEQMGWSRRRCIPHGGHQFALNIAAGLGLGGNESYPEVFAPFGGFADDTPVEGGMVGLPDLPGVGFEAKSDLMNLIRNLFDRRFCE